MPDGVKKLADASVMQDREVIKQLRDRELAASKWTVEQIEFLYQQLMATVPLKDTASDLGKTPEEVLDEVARFGSWIRQGRKYIGVKPVYVSQLSEKSTDAVQMRLFQVVPVPSGTNRVAREDVERRTEDMVRRSEQRASLEKAERERALKSSKEAKELLETTAREILAELGWDGDVATPDLPKPRVRRTRRVRASATEGKYRGAVAMQKISKLGVVDILVAEGYHPSENGGRDITGAMGAILAAQPDREMIVRYLQRTNEREKVLSFEHVSLVWLFARLGRVDEIGEINGTSAALAHCFADAYDLLEVTRAGAMRALLELLEGDASAEVTADLVVKVRPLLEAQAGKLEAAARHAANTGDTRLMEREIAWLKRHVETNPRGIVCSAISELSAGQVLRISEAAGLHTSGSTRTEESEIRVKLQMMGLAQDADQLVPTGVAANRRGLQDVFWDAVERRADGDPKWDRELVAALRR